MGNNPSYSWRSLWSSGEIVKDGDSWRVGNVLSISPSPKITIEMQCDLSSSLPYPELFSTTSELFVLNQFCFVDMRLC
ncbi:hypothetical protein JHK85_010056 [Glycine max]|nr:hypothetical protein JHK85_010056 [Glycine max]